MPVFLSLPFSLSSDWQALVVVLRLQFHPALADPPAVPVASAVKTSPQPQTPEELYLDLMKKVLTRAQMAGRYEYHALNPRTMTDALTLRLADRCSTTEDSNWSNSELPMPRPI